MCPLWVMTVNNVWTEMCHFARILAMHVMIFPATLAVWMLTVGHRETQQMPIRFATIQLLAAEPVYPTRNAMASLAVRNPFATMPAVCVVVGVRRIARLRLRRYAPVGIFVKAV